jgi:hypothetical protein
MKISLVTPNNVVPLSVQASDDLFAMVRAIVRLPAGKPGDALHFEVDQEAKDELDRQSKDEPRLGVVDIAPRRPIPIRVVA